MRAGVVVLGLSAACGRVGFDSTDGAPAAFVTGQRQPGGWGPLDLTVEGSVDWAHWGLSTPTDYNHKAGVTSYFNVLVHVGGGSLVSADKNNPAMDLSWSDGMPTPSAGPISTALLVDTPNPSGDGFQLAVAADRTTHKLRLFTGSWCARIRIEAELVDHGDTPPSWMDTSFDVPTASYELSAYQVDYRAAIDDAWLTVRLLIAENHCVTDDVGEVWLSGATLR